MRSVCSRILFVSVVFHLQTVVAQNDTQLVIQGSEEAEALIYDDPYQAIFKAKKAKSLAWETGFDRGAMKALITSGSAFFIIGDYDSARSYYHEAMRIAEVHGYRDAQASLHNNLGALHRSMGLHQLALEHYEQSLQLKEQIGAEACQIANTRLNIGNLYVSLEEYEKALEMLAVVRKQMERYSCSTVSSTAIGIGVTLYKLDRPDTALTVLAPVLASSSVRLQSMALNNTGLCYLKMEQYAPALKAFREGYRLNRDSLQSDFGCVGNLLNIGKVYTALQQLDSAKRALSRAQALIYQGDYPHEKVDLLENWAEFCEASGDGKQAYTFLAQAWELDDSLRHASLDQLQNQFFTVFQVQEKQHALDKERQEHAFDTARAKRNSTIAWILAVFGVVSAIFLVIVFRQRKRIAQKNALIQQYHKEHREAQQRTIRAMNTEGKREDLALDDIISLRKAGSDDLGKNSLKILTGSGRSYVRKISIRQMLDELSDIGFARVNLSTIVNLRWVESVDMEQSVLVLKIKVWNRQNERYETGSEPIALPEKGKIRQEFETAYRAFREKASKLD